MCLLFFPPVAIRLVIRDVVQGLAVWEEEARMSDLVLQSIAGLVDGHQVGLRQALADRHQDARLCAPAAPHALPLRGTRCCPGTPEACAVMVSRADWHIAWEHVLDVASEHQRLQVDIRH